MHRLKRLDASLIHMLMDSVRGVVVALPLNAAIGAIGAFAAGVLTLGLAMDTPWAPWDPASEQLFPPGLFTAASFLAGFATCTCASALLGFLISWREDAVRLWRGFGLMFLIIYGAYSLGAGTREAALMLTLLHLTIAIPALWLIPRWVVGHGATPHAKRGL